MLQNIIERVKGIIRVENKVDRLTAIVKRLERNVETHSQKQLDHIDNLTLLLGKYFSLELRKTENLNKIQDAEFKVFSQWGDDGIIQYLIQEIDIEKKIFVEFGVENYTEANTRFLLMNNNWSGLILDGSKENIDYVKRDTIYWKYNLKAKAAFITCENINQLIEEEGISGEIGLLSVDIDGNDYWVWKSINKIHPIVVIVEYNSVFGKERPVTIPYQKDFVRSTAHYSNLYYGSSLTSLCNLAEEKGYFFIGCNSAGNNAYFLRKDKIKRFKPLSPQEGYIESKFKESRDQSGNLMFLSGTSRLELIRRMPVINTKTGHEELL